MNHSISAIILTEEDVMSVVESKPENKPNFIRQWIVAYVGLVNGAMKFK
ncbi:hypothetical protein [Alteromonas facilis]|nr:hypothetical protein [Alteromonas facilis]